MIFLSFYFRNHLGDFLSLPFLSVYAQSTSSVTMPLYAVDRSSCCCVRDAIQQAYVSLSLSASELYSSQWSIVHCLVDASQSFSNLNKGTVDIPKSLHMNRLQAYLAAIPPLAYPRLVLHGSHFALEIINGNNLQYRASKCSTSVDGLPFSAKRVVNLAAQGRSVTSANPLSLRYFANDDAS